MSKILLGRRALRPNAPRCLPRSTLAGLHPARRVLPHAAVATSCRPGATCLSPIPARCRHRPRPSSAGLPPTRSSAATCKSTARCRALRSSTSGAVRPCAQAATGSSPVVRIFGTAPGAYGAGVEDFLGRDLDRAQVGSAYLAAVSHSYGGSDGVAAPAPGAFEARVATADMLVHSTEDPVRDLLEGSEDVAFIGGFAAAAAALGRAPDLIILDTTDPSRPRARPLSAAVASRYFVLLHEAYVADDVVRDFIVRENPAAAAAIAARLDTARHRGLWHPRRNDIDAGLAALMNPGAP